MSVAENTHTQLAVGRGQRVEKATSNFPVSVLLKLSFPAVATLRHHEAFGYLRKELHKLTKGKTSLNAVIKKLNDCTEPLRELAEAHTGAERAAILDELRSSKNAASRGVLMLAFLGTQGVTAMAAGLSLVVPSVFGPLVPGVVSLVGAATGLAALMLPKAAEARVLSANYDLAQRYEQWVGQHHG